MLIVRVKSGKGHAGYYEVAAYAPHESSLGGLVGKLQFVIGEKSTIHGAERMAKEWVANHPTEAVYQDTYGSLHNKQWPEVVIA